MSNQQASQDKPEQPKVNPQPKPIETTAQQPKPAEVTPNKTVTLPGAADGAARQENEGGPAAKDAKETKTA